MKKKGFTLVELLAVIAILAILVIVAMPNVLGMFNQAKVSSFTTEVKKIMDTATTTFTKDALLNSGKTVYYSSESNATLGTKKLDMSGNKKNYFIEMDRNGNFKRVVVYDSNYCYDVYSDFGAASIGILDNSNSIYFYDKIDKTSVRESDIWEAGNDSVSVTNSGSNYSVIGCEALDNASTNLSGGSDVRGEDYLYSALETEYNSGSIVKRYRGAHKDAFNISSNEPIYHFYASNSSQASDVLEKNNVLFANHCWQIIRTTDTGGVRMIYNGEASGGKCGSRGNHVGYASSTTKAMNSNYYYATSFEYSSGEFSLSGTKTSKTWNQSNSSSLIGQYTCLSTSSTAKCSTLYLVGGVYSATEAYLLTLNNSSDYFQYGTSPYSFRRTSLSNAGYVAGVEYRSTTIQSGNVDSYYYGSNVTWDGSKYILVNATRDTGAASISTHHFVCLNGTTSCDTVGYVYRKQVDTEDLYYITLSNGETNIDNIINKMLKNNISDSAIKVGVDKWYEKYLSSYSNYLEDTVFCNDRSIHALSGWSLNGDVTKNLSYKNINTITNLSCQNVEDQFSMSNNKAKLKYPIGLATAAELNLLNSGEVRATGTTYWIISPVTFNNNLANQRFIDSSGGENYSSNTAVRGVRPVISLKPGTKYIDGDGSKNNPYKIN